VRSSCSPGATFRCLAHSKVTKLVKQSGVRFLAESYSQVQDEDESGYRRSSFVDKLELLQVDTAHPHVMQVLTKWSIFSMHNNSDTCASLGKMLTAF